MNKRIRKKMHKRYLNDIALEISISSIWRQKLFDSNYGEKFMISIDNIKEIPKLVRQSIVKYHLIYQVYKTEEMLNEEICYD